MKGNAGSLKTPCPFYIDNNTTMPSQTTTPSPYTVEINQDGQELTVCYWCFDSEAEARQFFNLLKNGCTAYPLTVALLDSKDQLIEAWTVGDEYTSSEPLA